MCVGISILIDLRKIISSLAGEFRENRPKPENETEIN
jgi:hypothetical protein